MLEEVIDIDYGCVFLDIHCRANKKKVLTRVVAVVFIIMGVVFFF